MWRAIGIGIIAIVVGSTCGCSRGDNLTPEQVLTQFLEAVKTGDDARAGQLLTPLARTKTAEADMVIAPPGSATASFAIGQAEVKSGWARIESNWTDLAADGSPHTDRIEWRLRQVSDGWRIAGMSAELFPGEPPVQLNFENPEEMLNRQRAAEEEIARRDRQELQNPQAPTRQGTR